MNENGYLNSNGAIGFLGMLQIVLFVLKVTGAVDWSWWWILSPFWAPIALAALIWVLVAIIALAKKRPW